MKKWIFLLIPALLLASIAGLIYMGVIQLNRPSADNYPVRGVDVSHYQGKIDWNVLVGQGIQFAYIKATEGSTHVDSAFQTNWEGVSSTTLRAGAYHFFSFESPGLSQAENYTRTVSRLNHMLPPAIDIEPYGQFKSVQDVQEAIPEIHDWLDAVQAEYSMQPVIYTTEAFYTGFIADAFSEYDIWIRSVYTRPSTSIPWTFWQYSNRARLDGYAGEERFIDMNAFSGTAEDFARYPD